MSENIVLTNIHCKVCGAESDVEQKKGGLKIICPNKCNEPGFLKNAELNELQKMAEEIFKESEERARKKKAN